MTEEPQKPRCNVDDIVCQLGVLSHLRGMQTSLGSEDFKSKFPQFEGWEQKLVNTIQAQEAELGDALKDCGLASVEELNTISVQPAQVTEVEEESEP